MWDVACPVSGFNRDVTMLSVCSLYDFALTSFIIAFHCKNLPYVTELLQLERLVVTNTFYEILSYYPSFPHRIDKGLFGNKA